MNEDEASNYSRNFSIGSEQELDSLSAIQRVNVSQNTVNTFFPAENQDLDDNFPDSYKVGGIRPPHHGHPHQDYDQNQSPSQGQGHHDWSVEMSNMSESDSFHGPDQPSGKKAIVKDRDKFMKMPKSNTYSRLSPPVQQSGDSVHEKHKKKKHKRGGADLNERTEIYVINGKTNQAYTSMSEAPDLDNASVKKTGAYTSSHNHKSSIKDKEYHGEEKHNSVNGMSAPVLGKFPFVSKTAIVIDKKKLANFIKKKQIKQRECNSYVQKENGYDCECGRDREWHKGKEHNMHDSDTNGAWDMMTHTLESPCDSFGEIKFIGFGNKTEKSPYIRVDPNTEVESLWTIMTEHWKLPKPKLLISVTGGAQRFNLTPKHQLIFKRGLMNAATTTGAWIITGGMATGIMKFVGEAVSDHILTKGTSDKSIVALGIATWGCVANREKLVGERGSELWPVTYSSADLGKTKERQVSSLDHNHTHFILVDDGSVKKYGVEIDFVARLEKFISDQKIDTVEAEKQSVDLPVVKIVVEGGVNTMKTVCESVNAGIPVLVLQGSGRAADFIAYGYDLSKKDKYKNSKWDMMQGIIVGGASFCSQEALGSVRGVPKDFHAKLKEKAENIFQWEEKDSKEEIEKCVKQLEDILPKKTLINVFNLNEADTKDIDRAILYALLKANKSNAEAQLTLALAWNRSDIAREKIITPSNRKKWKEKEDFLDKAMFTALVQNKVDFIQLFLDCGVSFSKFLRVKTLSDLYEHLLSGHSDSSARLLKQLMMYIQQSWTAYISCRQPEKFDPKKDLLNSVGKIIVHLLGDESMNLYKDETGKLNEKKRKTNNWEQPEKELFLWAILFNRQEMAKMLWKMSENQIAGALVACALLKGLAVKAADHEELELSVNLQEHSQKYEDLATAVLGECYRKDSQLAHQLVVRQLNMYGRTTLFKLADANVLMKFMGHTCCQTKLNLIWKGRMAQYTQTWKILISIIFPFMIPLIKFTSNQTSVELHDKSESLMEEEKGQVQRKEKAAKNQVKPKAAAQNKVQDQEAEESTRSDTMPTDASANTIGLSAIYYLYTAPVTVFIINNIAYLIFLAIFTYFVLTDLYPDKPSVLEYITWGWTVTMLIEEFRQVWARDQHSILSKIRSWFSDIWNKFDLLMYMLFLVSVITRYAVSKDQFTWARITYSITLAVYYLRFMQVFFVEKHIGPKVIMIKNMIVDLLFFMLIFVIFLLSFGVAYQANLFPNSEPSWFLLKSVVYMPYWQMYGELFLDDMTGKLPDDCVKNETIWRATGGHGRCPANNALVPLLGAIYLVLTNILLINLLIAMFSYTFQKVQQQSENVWRFYRFSLVHEYYDRPFLCPPLIIFNHLFRFIKYILRKNGCVRSKPFNEFKLELSDENDRLTRFEKTTLEEYLSSSQRLELASVDQKVTTMHDRLERVIDDLDNIRESVKPLKNLAKWKERVTEDLDIIKELVKPLENLAKGMGSVGPVPPPLSSRMVHSDVKNDTEEMQIHLYELGNQVAQNVYQINQMMQMLRQILRNQERNMRTPHLEICDISKSADA